MSPAHVIEVARDHLLERGLLEFSLRALARDLGTTAPALYRHFPSKAALLEAVAGRSFDLLDAHLFEGLRGAGPHDRLARAAHGYVRFGLEHPRDFAVLAVLPGAFGSARLADALRAREAATFRFWTDRVREAIDAGVLAEGPPEEIAALFRSIAHGLISLYLRGALDIERDADFEVLFWASGIRAMEGLAGDAWRRDDLPDLVKDALAAGERARAPDADRSERDGARP